MPLEEKIAREGKECFSASRTPRLHAEINNIILWSIPAKICSWPCRAVCPEDHRHSERGKRLVRKLDFVRSDLTQRLAVSTGQTRESLLFATRILHFEQCGIKAGGKR